LVKGPAIGDAGQRIDGVKPLQQSLLLPLKSTINIKLAATSPSASVLPAGAFGRSFISVETGMAYA
jgi:hypothetical protein